MYREVVPFEGYPGDHAHIMGCTSFDVSPANGCKLESTAMAATGEPAAKHEVATAVSEPGVPKTELLLSLRFSVILSDIRWTDIHTIN